ncbi:CTP synthetase [candidate division MSBL1 archaeon SCGC-AAA259I09]|uniref:CTP synthase (glutamine hydrolyzing) n=2 Tax=candidate division MSBL1 TaxID=215777 RepID=A0A133UV96_9EURY|nr:CTP synthetase [candidate division MSBL1 archaeon SCGC-AAA259I09]KXB00810.1 CTP synthetase [candidate division MSBL1 archaeon SCGC-AAA259M10]
MTKFLFVTGGVLSGIGKGAAAASVGKSFQFRGLEVDMIKIDPYLNVDPGTLNPIEHGEVFVTDEVWDFNPSEDSSFTIAEIDQDFGTYERFLDKTMHPRNNITSGQVYLSVLLQERAGSYLGRTVQIIPHITDEIKNRIREVAKRNSPDILISEIGGTVGDIEASPFLEAIRQLRLEEPDDRTALIHVTLVPYMETIGQLKTKPTQHSVKTLLSAGLQPDIIVGRSDRPLSKPAKEKISLYSNVPKEAVISDPRISVLYELPLLFEKQGLGDYLCDLLRIRARSPDYSHWENIVNEFEEADEKVRIAMPGKYTQILDSYISINKALKHSAAKLGAEIKIEFVDTEPFEKNPRKLKVLEDYDGVLLTPGFGTRGAEGMIKASRKTLSTDIPFLGICFGAQLLFIAFCRENGLKKANSTEVDPDTPHPVVDLLPEQREISKKGGTMRLGGQEILIKKGTKLYEAYGKERIIERFRHRYHLIPEFVEQMEENGLILSATDVEERIVNVVELEGDHWVVGVQFHPEFTSRPGSPNPVYLSFVEAALEHKRKQKKD